MGQVSSMLQYQENIYRCGNTPIHKYIQQIIPFLEQRKDAANKLYEIKGKSEEMEKNLAGLVIWCNERISEILNFIPNE